MRHPGSWKHPAGGKVPHHPIHHGHRAKPTPKKPPPPAKAHKKPAPAKKPKKPPAKKPARKWSPGWDVACCSAQALGTLLGLSDADVLELYWLTADDPDAGAPIAETLAVAGVDGYLAGVIGERGAVGLEELDGDLLGAGYPCAAAAVPGLGAVDGGDCLVDVAREVDVHLPVLVGGVGLVDHLEGGHGLILGVALPEPHAIAVTPDGMWWSWGEPFNPADWPDLVLDETWAVLL